MLVFEMIFLATCQIDLAFIVDTSGSIGYFNFIDMLGFMKKVTRGLNIGPGNSQVAVVSFSNTARLEFGFEEHQDHASLERAMNFINYDAGGTATNKGISWQGNLSLKPAHGKVQPKSPLSLRTDHQILSKTRLTRQR